MKLSFSIPAKSSSKSKNPRPSRNFGNDHDRDHQSPTREQVTEFDSSKPPVDPGSKSKTLVIPPIQNEWRPHKKMKNLDLPPIKQSENESDQLRFEVVTESIPDSNIAYGLNLRKTNKDVSDEAGKSVGNGSDEQQRFESVEDVLLQKVRTDIQRLPEGGELEDYEEVPIEGFGAAMLAGYGWKEGRGIGKNAKEDVKIVQYERRGAREGLGFDSKKEVEKLGPEKSGQGSKEVNGSRERSDNRFKKQNDRGKEKHYLLGKDVRIIEGRDEGLKGRVLEVIGDDRVVLKLSRSEEELSTSISKVAELGSKEEMKYSKKLEEVKGTKEERRSRNKKSGDEEKSTLLKKSGSSSKIYWLRNHIRVRIISKELKRGRLYLKKGHVVDVVGSTTCDISIDESGELIQGVDQEVLETALPRRGGPVLVLYGKHKGAYGSLVERDLDKETAVVQDADSHELLSVRLEQIAEYIGDPSYIGY